jgi:sensor histidine kinase regulating citrate/malate metabolism
LPKKLYIDEIDIAVLLANALDNAIEYYQYRKTTNRTINFNIMTHNEYISIRVENEVSANIDVNNLTSLKHNTLYHGYGLENTKSIAERYDGDMHVSCQNNVFILSILLKNIKSRTLSTIN